MCSDAIRCLGSLCDEAQLADDEDDPQQTQITLICNLPVYSDLASEDSIFLGRKAQQKRIRKYMRMITRHTPGNLAAWEEAWKRWKLLTQVVSRLNEENLIEDFSSPAEASKKPKVRSGAIAPTGPQPLPKSASANLNRSEKDEELQTLWQNYTGFLAALGGCCLASNTTGPTEPTAMVEAFISEITGLLISENIFIRESVKEAMGTEMSPTLFAILFRHLEHALGRCFGPDGEAVTGMRNTLFVEQAVLVLKLILDRLIDPADCLLSIDFSTLMYQFANYLNKLPTASFVIRIKIKMCHLVETLMLKKEQIIVRDEMRLRNRLLEIIVEWTSEFALVSRIGVFRGRWAHPFHAAKDRRQIRIVRPGWRASRQTEQTPRCGMS